jgi:hypothetical protein
MKVLLNDFDVREHHMHTDEENEENGNKVVRLISALSDSKVKFCGKYVDGNGKAQFCVIDPADMPSEVFNLLCPKVGINAWSIGGTLVLESVSNNSVETYTFTPYRQNRMYSFR